MAYFCAAAHSVISYGSSSVGQFVSAMTSGELSNQLGLTTMDHMPSDICVFGGSWFGISGYQWAENPEDEVDGADPAWSFLLEGQAGTDGSSLQLFTAGLNFAIAVARGGTKHVTGGLHSGKGYTGTVANHRIDLPSPRQHSDTSGQLN